MDRFTANFVFLWSAVLWQTSWVEMTPKAFQFYVNLIITYWKFHLNLSSSFWNILLTDTGKNIMSTFSFVESTIITAEGKTTVPPDIYPVYSDHFHIINLNDTLHVWIVLTAGGGHLCGVCVPHDEVLCAQHQDHARGKSHGGYSQHGQCSKWTTNFSNSSFLTFETKFRETNMASQFFLSHL